MRIVYAEQVQAIADKELTVEQAGLVQHVLAHTPTANPIRAVHGVDRSECPMRHENGNCTVAGGFCTAVNDPICEALHNAYDCGFRASIADRIAKLGGDQDG